MKERSNLLNWQKWLRFCNWISIELICLFVHIHYYFFHFILHRIRIYLFSVREKYNFKKMNSIDLQMHNKTTQHFKERLNMLRVANFVEFMNWRIMNRRWISTTELNRNIITFRLQIGWHVHSSYDELDKINI